VEESDEIHRAGVSQAHRRRKIAGGSLLTCLPKWHAACRFETALRGKGLEEQEISAAIGACTGASAKPPFPGIEA
jgi:hypothetical protein